MSEIEIPTGWNINKVADIGEVITGSTPSTNNSDFFGDNFPFYKPADLDAGMMISQSKDGLSKRGLGKSRVLPENSILVVGIGASIGKTSMITKVGASNQQIHAIIPNPEKIIPKFLYYAIISPKFQNQIITNTRITSIPIINKSKFEKLVITFPSLENQKKIVQKLDYLFKFLNKRKNELLKISRTDFQSLTNFYYDDFLKDAFFGNSFNSSSENAENLLKKIIDDKKNDRKIIVNEINSLFTLPKSWCWCNLEDICLKITDGSHHTPPRTHSGKPILGAKNVRDGFIDFKNIQFVSETDFQNEIKRCHPEKGDVLLSCIGTVGRTAVVDEEQDFMLVRNVALLKLHPSIYPQYVRYWLRSPISQNHIETLTSTTAQPALFLNKIKKIPIPLAPINCQKLILDSIGIMEGEFEQLNLKISNITKSKKSIHLNLEHLSHALLLKAFSGKFLN